MKNMQYFLHVVKEKPMVSVHEQLFELGLSSDKFENRMCSDGQTRSLVEVPFEIIEKFRHNSTFRGMFQVYGRSTVSPAFPSRRAFLEKPEKKKKKIVRRHVRDIPMSKSVRDKIFGKRGSDEER